MLLLSISLRLVVIYLTVKSLKSLSIKIERQRAQNRTKAQCKKELINVEIIALFMASKTKKQLTF